jgi:DNA-binding GntR family transcriptional regulator
MRLQFPLILACSLAAFAQDPKPKVKALFVDAGTPPPNAVQKEMQALHALMLTSLTAIESGTTTAIPEAIHRVHEAKDETEKAITTGAWKPPRTDATVADFVKADEAFHGELVKVSKKSDVTATTRQLGTVLDGCTACHVRFRFPR